MKYTIEFELPDNKTVLKEIKGTPIKWEIWGYSGYSYAKPAKNPKQKHKEKEQGGRDSG